MPKKVIFIVRIILCFSFLILLSPGSDYAQEATTTTKVEKGLRFKVPEDWPVEERAGVVAPIPVEEYISIKFKDIEAKLGVIRQELTSKFEEVNSAVDKFKADTTDKLAQLEVDMDYVKTETQGLSLGLDQIKARLNSAEGDLGVLAEEMVALNAQNDNIVKQYNDLLVRIDNLEQEVQDIDYISPKEKAESWY
jgi:hypothetical protein